MRGRKRALDLVAMTRGTTEVAGDNDLELLEA